MFLRSVDIPNHQCFRVSETSTQVPHIYVCGSPEFIGPVRESCERILIEVISKQTANTVPQLDRKTFVTAAMGDGT
jgi:hypothetical protein